MRVLLLILFTLIISICDAQNKIRKENKPLNIQVFPGLGLNGKNPGSHVNYFSLNLISGYSYRNLLFELSGFVSTNVAGTRGIQISGLGNITGLNSSLSPWSDEDDRANLSGIQFSALYNYVKDNVFGGQISSFNQSKNLIGAQIGGINRVNGYTIGFQMAGLYNWSAYSMDGFQLSGFLNETNGRLVGTQLAPINIVKLTEGQNSEPTPKKGGLQIGIINYGRTMHGFQIGLINIAGDMRGTQVGLINISSTKKIPVNKRAGTTIGLLNIGLFEGLSFYTNALFYYNLELSTGTLKNSAILSDKKNKYFSGSLTYSWKGIKADGAITAWSIGLNKFHYKKSTLFGENERNFIKYGVYLTQILVDNKIAKHDRIYGANLDYGYKVFKKLGLYFFLGVTGNIMTGNHLINQQEVVGMELLKTKNLWAGLHAGIKIH